MTKIEKMIHLLREVNKDEKLKEKLKKDANFTTAQMRNRNAKLDVICMEKIKRFHELHALAVEIGFAERRENYDEIELTDGWHRFNYKPREPQ